MFAGVEGSRPLLVEVQALVAPTSLGTPRRAVVGWDANRLSMVIAVLEAHCGVRLSSHDVYLNVAGGLRIIEPAADLAVAAALVSSLANAALPADAVYFGEVSLSGVVRPVPQAAIRLREARKLGFTRAVVPESARSDTPDATLSVTAVGSLASLVAEICRSKRRSRSPGNEIAPTRRVTARRVEAIHGAARARRTRGHTGKRRIERHGHAVTARITCPQACLPVTEY